MSRRTVEFVLEPLEQPRSGMSMRLLWNDGLWRTYDVFLVEDGESKEISWDDVLRLEFTVPGPEVAPSPSISRDPSQAAAPSGTAAHVGKDNGSPETPRRPIPQRHREGE